MAIDAFEMALVHRVFRDEFNNLTGLIADVAPGDTQRAHVVSHHLVNVVA